jgi:hypothetical protein
VGLPRSTPTITEQYLALQFTSYPCQKHLHSFKPHINNFSKNVAYEFPVEEEPAQLALQVKKEAHKKRQHKDQTSELPTTDCMSPAT